MIGNAAGILFLYVFDAVLLAVPVSLILIWLFRRSVERAMQAASTAADNAVPLQVSSRTREPWDRTGIRDNERRSRLRLALVYAVAGASASVVWTWLQFQTPGLEFTWFRGFVIWYVFCWPVPATLVIVLAIPSRRSLWVIGAYLMTGMLIIVLWSTVSHAISGEPGSRALTNLQSFVTFLVLETSLPVIIILIVSSRSIRGVAPLALAGLLVFTFSSVAAQALFVVLVDVGGLHNLLLAVGPNWWFMLLTVPVGYVCWCLLVLLNSGYRRKSFSDVLLLTDSLWIIVAFLFSAMYANDFGWKGIAGLGGFVIYRAVVQVGLSIASRFAPDESGVRLLILRVFGFRSRSEKLFDSVAQRWRFRGGVAMIAGTDLASRTIDPDDTLAFLAGDLRSRFVRGADDLAGRLKLMDESRDPDGRFRITEFFCHKNTWSEALATVLGQSDRILMDLRGFSDTNLGCIFELKQLAMQQRLLDTVFVIDRHTDVRLLESTLQAASLDDTDIKRLCLETVEFQTFSETDRVYRSLCGC